MISKGRMLATIFPLSNAPGKRREYASMKNVQDNPNNNVLNN
jgi:hypothetical protein